MTRDCEHGQLARSCEVCQLTAALAAAERERDEARGLLAVELNSRAALLARFDSLVAERDEAQTAVRIVNLIDELRADEGTSVEIISDNAEFNEHPDCLIYVYDLGIRRSFAGASILECLEAARNEPGRC